MSDIELAFEIVQWLALAGIGAMLLGVLTLLAEMKRRLGPDPGPLVPTDGLPLEVEAPPILASETRTGQAVQLSDHRGRDVVLAFLSPTCNPCVNLSEHLNHLANMRKDVVVIVVVAPGEGFDYAAALGKRVRVIADTAGAAQVAYEVKRMPLVYVIDRDGKVAMRVVPRDLTDLEDMLDRFAVPQGNRPWVAVDPAAKHAKAS